MRGRFGRQLEMRELKTKEEFEKALSDAGDKPVFLDFSAGWCGPCKRIGPKFEDFSKEFTVAEFYKVKLMYIIIMRIDNE